MQTEPTLHDFVTRLLTDASAREAFGDDPAAALRDAGLPDVAPQDVLDAIPLVLDLTSAARGSEFGFSSGSERASATGTFDTDFGDSEIGFGDFADGGTLEYGLGSGGLGSSGDADRFEAGPNLHPHGLDATGLDPDAIGRGGDAVTGTLASYLTEGSGTLAGALTEEAGELTDGLTGGAETTGSMITGGPAQIADALVGPTSIGTPATAVEQPVDLPAGPGFPGRPADLPGRPADLPGMPLNLPELPVDAPDLPGLAPADPSLPVDLAPLPAVPLLPAVPPLPEVPSLPSAPEVVQGTVGGLTGQLPIVSDLTDGLDNLLPFGH